MTLTPVQQAKKLEDEIECYLPTDKEFLENTGFLGLAQSGTITLPEYSAFNECNLNFDLSNGVSKEAVYGAIACNFVKFVDVKNSLGFDGANLPNLSYLMRILYLYEPEHEVIQIGVPEKFVKTNITVQQFEKMKETTFSMKKKNNGQPQENPRLRDYETLAKFFNFEEVHTAKYNDIKREAIEWSKDSLSRYGTGFALRVITCPENVRHLAYLKQSTYYFTHIFKPATDKKAKHPNIPFYYPANIDGSYSTDTLNWKILQHWFKGKVNNMEANAKARSKAHTDVSDYANELLLKKF